jgi:hypothetical protein
MLPPFADDAEIEPQCLGFGSAASVTQNQGVSGKMFPGCHSKTSFTFIFTLITASSMGHAKSAA